MAEQSRAMATAAGGPVEVTAVQGADDNDAALFADPAVIDPVVRLADRIAASR